MIVEHIFRVLGNNKVSCHVNLVWYTTCIPDTKLTTPGLEMIIILYEICSKKDLKCVFPDLNLTGHISFCEIGWLSGGHDLLKGLG